jgi:hypothetical protein
MFSHHRQARNDEFLVAYQEDGNPIAYFTKEYTEHVLRGKWYPNPHIPSPFGEAIKHEGGSWSWDLRIEYSQRVQAQGGVIMPASHYQNMVAPTSTDRRDANFGEFFVAFPQDGNGDPIVYFTKEYTEHVLHGDWCPVPPHAVPLPNKHYGEALKKEGGSWSWDLRLHYAQKVRTSSDAYANMMYFAQNHQPPAHAAMVPAAAPQAHAREAGFGEFFVMNQEDGNPIVFFTQTYTEQILRANWYPNPKVPPQYGEAIKPEGGSWSWDLRLQYDAKQKAMTQMQMPMMQKQVPMPMQMTYPASSVPMQMPLQMQAPMYNAATPMPNAGGPMMMPMPTATSTPMVTPVPTGAPMSMPMPMSSAAPMPTATVPMGMPIPTPVGGVAPMPVDGANVAYYNNANNGRRNSKTCVIN